MIAKYFVFFVLIRFSFEADWGCPTRPKQPQLSPTLLDGYWIEVFSINDYLNSDSCSHFHITCNDISSCDFEHAIWDSYMLIEIYNGTMTQDVDTVKLVINKNDTLTKEENIDIVLLEDFLLIWKCNSTSISDSFASVFKRIKVDEDIESLWLMADYETRIPSVLQNFPIGIWNKINFTQCVNAAKKPITIINSFLVLGLIVINFITK